MNVKIIAGATEFGANAVPELQQVYDLTVSTVIATSSQVHTWLDTPSARSNEEDGSSLFVTDGHIAQWPVHVHSQRETGV